MASSILSQLQAVKAIVQASAEPLKKPFTRPSILFGPKEAADIDLDTLLGIALSGLEVLISTDERFRSYKNDLFSHKSRELDRELMNIDDNNRINVSISSYLRLLAGYLQLPASLKTLEYLIRRYKIHMYNMEDFVLCALPYHDTHAFVRIVQLLHTGNNKWSFLDGVKVSGAPPPRSVIVQQCISNLEVLEVLCDYSSPTKKYQPSRQVITFCTAVVVEVLGSITTVNSDIVNRISKFLVSGLHPGTKGGLDHQAGALMIVSLLAKKVSLNHKLVKSLMISISDLVHEYAKDSTDLQWLRLSLMALINLVQLQSVDLIPKKALDTLRGIRDIAGILSGLSKEFNIDRFLMVLLECLVDYSSADDLCHLALMSIIEQVPLRSFVEHVVVRVLSSCMKSYKDSNSTSALSGSWIKKVLIVINKNYPSELRKAVHKFLESTKVQSKNEGATLEILGKMMDSNLDLSLPFSDSKVWFGLHHPKPAVRRATLCGLNTSDILKTDASNGEKLMTIQGVILRQLLDDDLSVVQAALSLDRLSELLTPSDLLEALSHVLKRCVHILISSSSDNVDLAIDVATSFLKIAVLSTCDQKDYSKKVAAMLFPLLLVQSKTRRLSVALIESAKQVKWTFFQNLVTLSGDEKEKMQKLLRGGTHQISMEIIKNLGVSLALPREDCRLELIESFSDFKLSDRIGSLSGFNCSEQERRKLQKELHKQESISSLNMEIINSFSTTFLMHPDEYMPWLVESCSNDPMSKTLFFLIVMQSFFTANSGSSQFLSLFEECISALMTEWEYFDSAIEVPLMELKHYTCRELLYLQFDTDVNTLNATILICLFWRLLEGYISIAPTDASVVNDNWLHGLQRLFSFFATSRLNHVFQEHIHYLVRECKISPARFLSKFFTEKDVPTSLLVESLNCFANICNEDDSRWLVELLAEFPPVLVALSNDKQDIRTAAMGCIESLYALWCRVDFSTKKNGNTAVWSHFLDELLRMLVQQKRLIISDKSYLSSLLTSLLSASSSSLLVPQSNEQRFDQSAKDNITAFILGSALRFSAYGKLVVLSLLKGLGSAVFRAKEVESLLDQLLKKRSQYYFEHVQSSLELSEVEVQILCLLLESCIVPSTFKGIVLQDHLQKALRLDNTTLDEPAVIRPCVTVLQNMNSQVYTQLKTETQELLFREFVHLFRSSNSDVHDSTREALLRLNISCSTVGSALGLIFKQESPVTGSALKKKKKSNNHLEGDLYQNGLYRGEKALCFLGSLLDILLLKKDIMNRVSLVGPLFKLLKKLQSHEWMSSATSKDDLCNQSSDSISQNFSSTISYVQQSLLLVLEDICASLTSTTLEVNILNEINIKMLVEFANAVKDGVTRNHVFSVLSSIAKVAPEKVLEHMIDIITVIGESTITQIDNHSQHVFEDLISAVVPYWLSKTKNADKLLQIFMNVLPDVAEHRRLSIVVYLLRTLGENNSLASFFNLIFRSLILRKELSCLQDSDGLESVTSLLQREWEYRFALQISEQYSCTIWLSSLVTMLQLIGSAKMCQGLFTELLIAIEFILQKLQDPQLAFQLESGADSVGIQRKLEELMKGVIYLMPLVDSRKKELSIPYGIANEVKLRMHVVLKTIRMVMIPSTYFEGIIHLLGHTDINLKKKTLGLLCESLREDIHAKQKRKGRRVLIPNSRHWFQLDESSLESFGKMCLEIVCLIDGATDESSTALKLTAVSTIEVLASRFPSNVSVFSLCLTSVAKNISSQSFAVSSNCLRTSGALINVVGPRALAELPNIMKNVITKSSEIDSCLPEKSTIDDSTTSRETFALSILAILEAVIEKLGSFLNPYLGEIIKLLVLCPEFVSESSPKLKSKADAVRKILTEKIPVRLALQPLLNITTSAIDSGDSSVVIAFEMLANLFSAMDRSSVGGYHGKIFDQCLVALDMRRQHPHAIQNLDVVEGTIVNAMVALTMKLTETMFKPLFIKSIEWAESEVDGTGDRSIDRAISFYGLVDRLAENHRSLFVPYFKYLLDGSIQHLTDAGETKSSTQIRKKKKAKIQEAGSVTEDGNVTLSVRNWHLRSLVLSSLHKCFSYDSGSLKFVDSTNFQALLKPIVSQLVVEPPTSLEDHPFVPSVQEVDDLLVACIGQMAVAAGSDLLWKPLNHEVLMRTRSDKIRSRILGLRIIKQFLENLKEEYLVLLAETIPFLGELLEDVELPVKSLAQDALKEMETMSGETLRQYL